MATENSLFQQMDELLSTTYPPEKPGASAIVVKNGQVLLRKGYGLANLELNVAMKPEMVFRLGSITKQFTAVCILMLLEQGFLDLQDEITRFLPDYPTQGRKITIEHLLTHTSGIKSYTDIAEWLTLWRKDMSVDELIAFFKDQPMDFEPGEQFLYNNSGYILLGAIIEKISGIAYADYVQQHIFDRLGMAHSLYDDTARLVPGRVAGYARGVDGFVNSAYLSMSQPYAAGSLASNVDDLARWDTALYTEILVKQATLDKAFQSYQLKDGELTSYGYGWGIGEYEGHQFIEHGGGINGFTTGATRVPDFHLYAAVLANLEAATPDPSALAFRLATIGIGKPWVEPTPISISEEELDAYLGVYQINTREERIVTREGTRLFSQRTGGARFEVFPIAPDIFFVKEAMDRFVFTRNATGQVDGMQLVRRIGPSEAASRTDKPLPSMRSSIKLPDELLGRYTGIYEIAPGMTFTISLADGQLSLLAPGQEKLPLLAESPESLFTPTVDITLIFKLNDLNQVKEVVLHQGAQNLPVKKLR
jgi:CubicO group peptidase (beta-lactamase class C family)